MGRWPVPPFKFHRRVFVVRISSGDVKHGRMVRHSIGHWLMMGVVLLQPWTKLQAAEATGENISDRQLYDLLARDLKDRLARKERFTLLPRNISGVSVSRDSEPIFWMQHEGAGVTNLDVAIDTYRRRQETFRLVQDGAVLGASESEALLSADSGFGTRRCAVVGGSGIRRFDLGAQLGTARPLRTASGWWLVFGTGSVRRDLDSGSEPDLQAVSRIIEGKGEVILITRSAGPQIRNNSMPLSILVKDRHGLHREEFYDFRHMAFARQGVIRTRHGRWLAMDYHLAVLSTNTPPEPSDTDVQAVIDAATAGNCSAFRRALEAISFYPPAQLKELRDRLAAVPDAAPGAGEMEEAVTSEVQSLKQWSTNAAMVGDVGRQAQAATAAYQAQAEQYLGRVQAARAGRLDISPANAADNMRNNFQLFDGRWVRNVRTMRQDSATEALVQVTFLDASFQAHEGVFLLDQDEHLRLLGEFDAVQDPERDGARGLEPLACQEIVTTEGENLLFFPRYGLARFAEGKLEWIDRSAPFKLLRETLGCDKQDRIFFTSLSPQTPKSGSVTTWQPKKIDYWVYRPNAAPQPPVASRLFPVTSLPLMDASNRVWFVSWADPRRGLTNVLGSLSGTEPVETAVREMESAPAQEVTAPESEHERAGIRPEKRATLYCFENGYCQVSLTNLSPDIVLLNGTDGAVFGISKRLGLPGTFLIQDRTFTVVSNLHEMARENFDLLIRSAPTECVSPRKFLPGRGGYYPAECNPALYRSEDLLWISQDSVIEAYQDGRPLGIQTRLALMNYSPQGAALLGPLRTKTGLAQVIVSPGEHGNTQIFWAHCSLSGVDLQRGGNPETPWSGDGYLFGLMLAAGLNTAPVAGLQAGCLYSGRDNNALEASGSTNYSVYPNAGQPELAVRDGELIVQTVPPAYRGYRLCSGQTRRDLPVTFVRDMRLLEETADGALLGCNAEGLLWLGRDAKGDYSVRRELRLKLGGQIHSFVGETADRLFVTVLDGNNQAYLAVIEKSKLEP